MDYEATREDERSGIIIQSSMFAVAVAIMGIMGVLVSCSVTDSAGVGNCVSYPEPILAFAPFAPLALIVYVLYLGSVGTVRSFYMRSLEREIRAELLLAPTESPLGARSDPTPESLIELAADQVRFATDPDLLMASYVETTVSHTTTARGVRGPRQMTVIVFAGVLFVFGGLTVTLMTQVTPPYRVLMAGMYGLAIALIARETYLATVHGRVLFRNTVIATQFRARESLFPSSQAQLGRSLLSYLVLPRPDDLLKGLFFPAFFIIGYLLVQGHSVGSLSDGAFWTMPITRAACAFTILELLIYQSRYQWNDILGLHQDVLHPLKEERRRLPGSSREIAIRASEAAIVIRLWIALVLSLFVEPSLLRWTLLTFGAVYGTGLVYEWLRFARPKTPVGQRLNSYVIFGWVGIGYAIRGTAGLAVAGVAWNGSAGVYLASIFYLLSFGSMFVLLTWGLEAASYCLRLAAVEGSGWKATVFEWIEHKPHLSYLLQSARAEALTLPRLDSDQALLALQLHRRDFRSRKRSKGPPALAVDERHTLAEIDARLNLPSGSEWVQKGTSEGALTRLFQARGPIWTPWNFYTLIASTASGVLGWLLAGEMVGLAPTVALSTLGGLMLIFSRNRLQRLLSVLISVFALGIYSWLSTSAQAQQFQDLVVLLLPWAITAGTCTIFRSKNYLELKPDFSWVHSAARKTLILLATPPGAEALVGQRPGE